MKTPETNHNYQPEETAGMPPALRQKFIEVFNQLQHDPECSLLAYAKSDPDSFYKMAVRLIPAEGKDKASEAPAALKKRRAFVRLDDGTEIDF